MTIREILIKLTEKVKPFRAKDQDHLETRFTTIKHRLDADGIHFINKRFGKSKRIFRTICLPMLLQEVRLFVLPFSISLVRPSFSVPPFSTESDLRKLK